MALISVIIPMFNAAPWISQALGSVVSQAIRDIEIIAVDDGSIDGTADIVARDFTGVQLVKTQHQGPSRARNLGTGLAKGEFIQYLDADDLLAENKIKIQLEALESLNADVAYGPWQKLVQGANGQYHKDRIVSAELVDPEIDLFTDFWSPPAAYLFRRSIIARTGGWNENLPVIQDARFVLDCALYGARFAYCRDIMAYYRDRVCGSVSNKDPVAFIRDCLFNAKEVESWWRRFGGGIDRRRRQALIRVYGYVAREGFLKDRQTFESSYAAINRLIPFYLPERLRVLNLLYRVFGYQFASKALAGYRRMNGLFEKDAVVEFSRKDGVRL